MYIQRKDYSRARQLTERVQQRAASGTLTHDLHLCRSQRILGRIRFVEGSVDVAVFHFEKALELTSEMDDSLERARSFHFLAQAKLAQGDEAYAKRCHNECEQLLRALGNDYQLRRLGYVASDDIESVREPPALAGLSERSSGSNSLFARGIANDPERVDSQRESSVRESLLELSKHSPKDDTLVATSRNSRPPSKPN